MKDNELLEKLRRLLSKREYTLHELERKLKVSKSYIYTLLKELNVKMVKVWIYGDYFEPAYYLEGAVIGIERYKTKS